MNEYERFFNVSLDIFVIAGPDGYIRHSNDAFTNSLGWTMEDLQDIPYLELVHPDERKDVINALENLSEGHPIYMVITRLLCKDNTYKSVRWRVYLDLENNLLYGIGQEDKYPIEMQQSFFEQIAQASPNGIIIVNQDGNILFSNRQASEMFGYDGDLHDVRIENLIPARFRKGHIKFRREYSKDPHLRPMGIGYDLTAIRKDGSEFLVEIGLNPINTLQGRIVVCSIIDISVEAKIKRSMYDRATQLETEKHVFKKQAQTDSLTSLPNRRGLMEELTHRLKRASESNGSLSILLIDIDDFKQVNDTHGHLEGDKVLETLGRVLHKNSRKIDYVARFGGEEFVIILPDTNSGDAILLAKRIHRSIISYDWPVQKITVSIGVSSMRFPHTSTLATQGDRLISEADQALYYSKNNGRNQVTHFDNIE
jgi:diguanylate cyclase (GGDEF)-like protein/PAS domain S-box-containing protein